jgi:hypothetical protein
MSALWVGGPVPLGYRSIAKKLIVVEDKAEQGFRERHAV